MSHRQDGFLLAMLVQKSTKFGEGPARTQRGIHLNFPFKPYLISHEESRLRGSFEGAGENRVHLCVRRSQKTPDRATLLDPLFVETALLILSGAVERLAGAGVA